MADDLSNFIESQKKKLERERLEMHPRTTKESQIEGRSSQRTPVKTQGQQSAGSETEDTGLRLGGYEKVQQKLRQERMEEYRKFLAEKNMRSTGKVDTVLVESGRSPIPSASRSRKEKLRHSDDSPPRPPQSNRSADLPPRSRRRGKENMPSIEDSPRGDDYYGERELRRRPENLFERYEDILRRKRAEERRYRGRYDDPELDSDIRSMKLTAPYYKFNSRSDGYLSRRHDDDDELCQDNLGIKSKFGYLSGTVKWTIVKSYYIKERKPKPMGYDQPRSRRRNNWDANTRRVRFDDEMDMDMDDTWMRGGTRSRRQFMDDDLGDDDDDLLDWVRRRGRRGRRRNSAHEERRKYEPEQPPVERSQTDTNIRSQSAPLAEGTGFFGGSQDSRVAKLKKQEQYKKELEAQIKEHEEIKKREKFARMGRGEQDDLGGNYQPQHDKGFPRHDDYSTTERPPLPHHQQQVANYGPSSRPPPHPALYTSPYDDPYYYYGSIELGVPNGPSVGVPSRRGATFASAVGAGLAVGGPSGREAQSRGDLSYSSGFQGHVTPGVSGPVSLSDRVQHHTSTLVSNPPGGQSSFGFGAGTGPGPGGSDGGVVDKKRAAQQAYQEELRRQMQEKEARKKKEHEERESDSKYAGERVGKIYKNPVECLRISHNLYFSEWSITYKNLLKYEMKKEEEIRNYNPWGKGGAGAPLRDTSGQLVTNLNLMHKLNQEGKVVSPRDAPAPVEKRFELNLEASPVADLFATSNVGLSGIATDRMDGAAKSSPFGRSDPLKEAQPGDEVKKTAKMEYQEYLKQQVLEKEKKKKEELEKRKREEELEEKRLQDQRQKMQEEFEKEQEEKRRKEEENRKKNAELLAAQDAKKKEVERKKKEMEEKRQAELKRKLDEEMASKRTTTHQETRTSSPPIPTMRKKLESEGFETRRVESPPIPTIANKQHQEPKPASPLSYQRRHPEPEPSTRQEPDQDILSQLTALRQQLKNEEHKIQSQMNRTSAQAEYSHLKERAAPHHPRREDSASRRSRRDIDVFEKAMANKAAVTKKDSETYSAADEFNRMKYEDSSSLAGEFRSRFPQPATTNSMLDLQQQAYLREQEDKLASLRTDFNTGATSSNTPRGPARSGSKTSLLESESQFIAVDETHDPPPGEALHQPQAPRQPSARERRRWKHLEEMAKTPKPLDSYKPPTPGGFSLNSVTSFNVDSVAVRNEERLRRLEALKKAGEKGDPDQVLKRFINRPMTQASEDSLETDTFYSPINW